MSLVLTGQTACDCRNAERRHAIGKHPWTRKGCKDASQAVNQIKRWFRQWPTANIGVATGAISGLIVLDIDPQHDGEENLRALLTKYQAVLPPTLVVNTGGGGTHFYYTRPQNGRYAGTVKLDGFGGVDVRADGTYVVAPPSLHASGRRYEWDVCANSIAAAPQWLLDLTSKREPAKIISISAYRPRPGAGDYWRAKATARIPGHNRNDTGFWLACQLRDDGLEPQAVEANMLEYQRAVTSAADPYTEQEAIKTARSAFTKQRREPARRIAAPRSAAADSTREAGNESGKLDGAVDNEARPVFVGNYREDRAVRHAVLGTDWHLHEGKLTCTTTRNLTVLLDRPDPPLSLEEAQGSTGRMNERTILTIRIAMALWNLAHYERRTAPNGSVMIPFIDILRWRGIKPHQDKRVASEASWDHHDLDRVRDDFRLAALIYVKGRHTICVEGQSHIYQISDQYVRISEVSMQHGPRGAMHVMGVGFNPGDWINTYIQASNYQLALVDRQIFHLNPQNEQHELRLALYLTERWRMRAHKGACARPMTMKELLHESVIEVDTRHMIARFAPRIIKALQHLVELGIVGCIECVTPADTTRAQVGAAWLASEWRILPPSEILATLNEIAARPLSSAA